MQITIDAKTGRVLSDEAPSGVFGFFSWQRLSEIMRAAGEIRPDEQLVSYGLDERGVHYRVERGGPQ